MMKISIQEDVAEEAFCANAVVRPIPTAHHRESTSDTRGDATAAADRKRQFACEKKISVQIKKVIAISISTVSISADQNY